MCGRYFLEASLEEMEALFGPLANGIRLERRYNIAPEQPIPVVRNDALNERHLALLRWGLVPAWSKGPDSRYTMINARAETVKSKPAYRNAFKHWRCLIPAEGFYEWKAGKGGKTPFLIRRQGGEPFAMAGLWERWHGGEGETIESCTIIVTDANDLVHEIHDRMPVILGREDHAAWLDPDNNDTDGLLAMLRPVNPERWTTHPVSRQVNSPRNDGPDLLEPVESEG